MCLFCSSSSLDSQQSFSAAEHAVVPAGSGKLNFYILLYKSSILEVVNSGLLFGGSQLISNILDLVRKFVRIIAVGYKMTNTFCEYSLWILIRSVKR